MGLNIEKGIAALEALQNNIPRVIANNARRHFVASFRNEGFTDAGLKKWKPRKSKTKQDRRTGRKRNILTQSGALRRSIRAGVVTKNKVQVGSYNIPYATFHNQGEGSLPKRKFVGKSRVLTSKNKKDIDILTRRALDKFNDHV